MWPTEDPTEQLRWRIPCTTPHGEQGTVTVLVMGDRIALVLPPGDTLVFTADEAVDVANLLENAAGHTIPVQADGRTERPPTPT
ncbi:hypothetical protein [Saccharopolyspora sp. CA-218241]|uniref:hypothetical protein n=1 Tax=Saccharopolyspora sp. CA-218241 TaxID=3240027 RepID=UPI003D98AA81